MAEELKLKISLDQFALAIGELVDGGLVLPYHLMPGQQGKNGALTIQTQEQWQAYGYNPPQYSPYEHPDPEASPKPEWSEIINALGVYMARHMGRRRREHINLAKAACEAHVSRYVYGARSFSSESAARLSLMEDLATDRITQQEFADAIAKNRQALARYTRQVKHVIEWINQATEENLIDVRNLYQDHDSFMGGAPWGRAPSDDAPGETAPAAE